MASTQNAQALPPEATEPPTNETDVAVVATTPVTQLVPMFGLAGTVIPGPNMIVAATPVIASGRACWTVMSLFFIVTAKRLSEFRTAGFGFHVAEAVGDGILYSNEPENGFVVPSAVALRFAICQDSPPDGVETLLLTATLSVQVWPGAMDGPERALPSCIQLLFATAEKFEPNPQES